MYTAKVIADSIARGVRLVTMEVTFPRFILAEFNTHRMFSRNSASSRAIPVERRIAQVRDDPFVPEAFSANCRGMQARAVLDDRDGSKARDVWLRARDAAVEQADRLVDLGVHKQHANRLLEPFAWHTVVVSATEWENFFHLRTHKDAQPEMQITATRMREAYATSTPREAQLDDWHLPYVSATDLDEIHGWASTVGDAPWTDLALAMSVTRCAAVSYERQHADRTIRDYIERCSQLRASAHWSPFEHQARVIASADEAFIGNFRVPWLQYRKTFPGEAVWVSAP